MIPAAYSATHLTFRHGDCVQKKSGGCWRGQETSTLRGIITGTLAAGTIVALGYLGADLNAEQIGLVLATITGIDAILKIALPDKLGGAENAEINTVQNISGTNPTGVDSHAAYAPDRLRALSAHPGPGQASPPDAAAQPYRDGMGHDGSA